jgi:hypothetical protein
MRVANEGDRSASLATRETSDGSRSAPLVIRRAKEGILDRRRERPDPTMNLPPDFKDLLEEFAREGAEHVVPELGFAHRQ